MLGDLVGLMDESDVGIDVSDGDHELVELGGQQLLVGLVDGGFGSHARYIDRPDDANSPRAALTWRSWRSKVPAVSDDHEVRLHKRHAERARAELVDPIEPGSAPGGLVFRIDRHDGKVLSWEAVTAANRHDVSGLGEAQDLQAAEHARLGKPAYLRVFDGDTGACVLTEAVLVGDGP